MLQPGRQAVVLEADAARRRTGLERAMVETYLVEGFAVEPHRILVPLHMDLLAVPFASRLGGVLGWRDAEDDTNRVVVVELGVRRFAARVVGLLLDALL